MGTWGSQYKESQGCAECSVLLQWDAVLPAWWGRITLKVEIGTIQREEMGYVYYKNGSKNCKGNFLDRSVSNNGVKFVRVPEAGQRCHVALLYLYLSKLPVDTHQVDTFYIWPLQKLPTKGPWH